MIKREGTKLSQSGLGRGIGAIFNVLDERTQKAVFDMANENSEFSAGLGSGLGLVYLYLPRKLLDQHRI